jgi:hypothetical protein
MLSRPKVPDLPPPPPPKRAFVCLEGVNGNPLYVDPHAVVEVGEVGMSETAPWEAGPTAWVVRNSGSHRVMGSARDIAARLSEARRGVFRDGDV